MVVNEQHGRRRQQIDPFRILDRDVEIGCAWQEMIKDFEEETSYFEITGVKDKIGAFSKLMVDRKSRN